MSDGGDRMRPRSSALYEGTVRHRRYAPGRHAFDYRVAQLFLDLDEVEAVLEAHPLWSTRGRNLAEFRRSDYLGPHDRPLAQAVRERVAATTGTMPIGPIRLLTHARYFGFAFNPVSFYYCYGPDHRTLEHVVAEITNTPWRERHAYVLPVSQASSRGRALQWKFDKTFHVSPFMPMQRRYAWTFTPPGDTLHVHMDVFDGERREFDATLMLRRHRLDTAALSRVLWRYPAMTLQVIGAIHWQALKLWLKRMPVHDHPAKGSAT